MKVQQKIKSIAETLLFILLMVVFTWANPDTTPKFNGWKAVGPSGGDIRALTIDPKDKNKLYLTTLDSQVYGSTDAGKNWKMLVNFNLSQVILDNIIVDSEDSNTIFVSGHRHRLPGGFFYTKDGGATWKESSDMKNEAIHALAQSDSDPNILVAGGPGRVFISYNKGENWKRITDEKVAFSEQFVDSAAFSPSDSKTIYIGTTWRPYKSTDGGKTWNLISKGMIDDSDVFALDVDPKSPDHIVASACSGIYESLNGGELWSKIQGIPSQSRRTKAILRNPSGNGAIYAGTTEGFWMAPDGKTWTIQSQRELEVNAIAVHPEEPNKVYIATNNYGLMVSTDGGRNFTIQNGNFTSRFMQDIVPDIQIPNRFYATTNNTTTGGGFIFISEDGGKSWTPATKNLSVIRIKAFTLLQDPKTPDTILIGTNLGIYRSLDRGKSWNPLPAGVVPTVKATKKTTKGKKVTKTVVAVAGPKKIATIKDTVRALAYTTDGKNGILAATDNGLYRTYNSATGWEKLSLGAGINEQIFAIHASESQPMTIWVGTSRSGVLSSKDDGLTWQKSKDIVDNVPVTSIITDPQNINRVYVGTSQTFYVSRDGGATFIRRGGGLPLGSYNSILINPNNPNEVYAASSAEGRGGLFYSADAGQNWKQVDNKDIVLPSRRVWTMAFDPKNFNTILIGTHSSGIYRLEKDVAEATTETVTRPRVATNGN